MIAKITYTLVFFLALFFAQFWLGGINAVLATIVSLGTYAILYTLLVLGWKKLRKKETGDIQNILLQFFFSVSILLTILIVLIASWSYYANEKNPSALTQYTLSNGEKTVIFQSMIHIARPEFYKQVQRELQQAKKEGFVYFYEGVREGSPENAEKLNQALGFEFDVDFYKNFSRLYGVEHQDTAIFLGVENDLDFNIDVSVDDIISEYEAHPQKNKQKKEMLDVNEVFKATELLTERQLTVLQYINKALLNTIFNSGTALQNMLGTNQEAIMSVILEKRDEVVAEEISKSEYDKIFVTYGALHFEGIFELLKKDDPNWRIISEKQFYPITQKH